MADEEDKRVGKPATKLEDAARHLNKMFTLCLSDRCLYLPHLPHFSTNTQPELP